MNTTEQTARSEALCPGSSTEAIQMRIEEALGRLDPWEKALVRLYYFFPQSLQKSLQTVDSSGEIARRALENGLRKLRQ